MAPEPALSLRAEDAADLEVISACLQDALVVVGDLAYDRAAGSFVLVANRFRWETPGVPAEAPGFERTLCALAFAEVETVAYRGFRRGDGDRILSLLALRTRGNGAGAIIELDFSGGAAIRLTVRAIRCHARDLGEPWPTAWQPAHPEDAP